MEKKYWDKFYDSDSAPSEPSNFAKFVIENYKDDLINLFDLGCGNGRDTFYFASQGISSTGIDQSKSAIEVNRNKIPSSITNIQFHQGDFPSYKYSSSKDENLSIYSRFTLHSINYDEEKILLENLISLKNLDMLFIEVRSIKDEIYGQGKEVGKHEFVTTHYRRFIDSDILKNQLQNDFDIKHFSESTGFSKTNDSDPCLIRIVAKRKK